MIDYDKKTKKIFTIEIKIIVQVKNWKHEVEAIINTGCANTVLNSTIVLIEYYTNASEVIAARHMDGKFYNFNTSVRQVNF